MAMFPLSETDLRQIADALEFFQIHSDDESQPATVSIFPTTIRVFYGSANTGHGRDFSDYHSVSELLAAIGYEQDEHANGDQAHGKPDRLPLTDGY
jgi:hypothetical protein